MRSAPSLKGVFGRKSAALEDFRYSNAMKRANLVWDEDNLRAYIRDPAGQGEGQPHALWRHERRKGRRRRRGLSEDAEVNPQPQPYSITSSANVLSLRGMSKPWAWAVLTLRMNSNLVGS